MSQNTSSAVMAQRHEPHDSLDYFPTPPWATRALCEMVMDTGLDQLTACEPCCGELDMVRPLQEYFGEVYASDVHDYGVGAKVADFLWPGFGTRAHWYIFNPPFLLAEQFIEKALSVATRGVACFVRTQFLETQGRYNRIFSPQPPALIAQFAERVNICKGRLDIRANPATAFCWLVWRLDRPPAPTVFQWLEPCRERFDQAHDYPQPAQAAPGPLLTGMQA